MEHAGSLAEALDRADGLVGEAAEAGAELVLLPEYWFVPRGERMDADSQAEYEKVPGFIEEASERHGVALAGNGPLVRDGDLHNACYVHDAGDEVLVQPKLHPMPPEEAGGVAPAEGLDVVEVRGANLGVAVCADILYPEVPRILSLRGADVVLCPVMSPYRGEGEEDPTRDAREDLFVARAYDASAYVLKAGGFSSPDEGVVGRSLVTAPWGTEARYQDQWSQEILHVDLDVDRVREHREGRVSLERRAPWAYRDLLDEELGSVLHRPDG
jgi:nitrilase